MDLIQKIASVAGSSLTIFIIAWNIDLERRLKKMCAELILERQKNSDEKIVKDVAALSDGELDALLNEQLRRYKKD